MPSRRACSRAGAGLARRVSPRLAPALAPALLPQREEASFKAEFEASAAHIADSLQARLQEHAWAAASLAQVLAQSASFASPVFPNVTLPGFDALGATLLPLFASRAVCWMPLLASGPAARAAWETYALTQLGASAPAVGAIYVSGVNATRARAPDGAMLVPLWQISPASAANNAARLLDLASVPVERAAMEEAARTLSPALCDILVLVQDRGSPGTPRPSSIMFAPVVLGGAVAGFASVVFSWDDALAYALPDSVVGLDAVLTSGRSGSTYSFRVAGDAVQITGAQDVHEASGDLAALAMRRTIVAGGHNLTLALYPTAAQRSLYVSATPGIACAVVVCIIVAMSLLFWVYD